jgi:glycosyltransferase involved in cell wall biosynthesis
MTRPVAMLTHSYYDEDPRVRREAEALVRAGRPVDVYALRREGDATTTTLDGVTVHRLDVQRHQGARLRTYLVEYLDFFARAAAALTQANARRHYALVQVHTLPDFLVFAALHFRLAGIPVVLDLHEAMPEFFRARFPRASSAPAQAALRLQERLSLAAATAAITVNDALAARLRALGIPADKVHVVRNTPDLTRFDPARFPARTFMADGVLRLVYAGALTPTYELDVVIDALRELRRRCPTLPVRLDLYGRGDSAAALEEQVARAALADAATVVRFHGRIPIEDVPAALAKADVGLAPTRRTDFTDYSLSTKIFEYAAMGKPVVASRLPLVAGTLGEAVATYEPGSAASLATAIIDLVDDPTGRALRETAAAERVRDLAWDREGPRYVELIESLVSSAR